MEKKRGELEYSNAWFERTRPIWEKYLLPEQWVDSYLEIGCAEGASLEWVLENLKPTRAVGVDPYVDPKGKNHEAFAKYERNCHERLAEYINNGTLEMVKWPSQKFLGSALASDVRLPGFDLIYVDGDHNGYECMLDMMLAYQLLASSTREIEISLVDKKGRLQTKTKAGGIMIVDDLQRVFHFGKPLVKIAVWQYEFLMHGKMKKLWEDGRQCAFVRID